MKSRLVGSLWLALLVPGVSACELCAIYSATGTGQSSSGFLFTLSEQYISAHTLQGEGEPFTAIPFLSSAYLDSSFTHLVPGYNFSSRFGVSLNAPIIYRDFRRTEFLTTANGTVMVDESGSVFGLGDLALVGRWTLLQKNTMKRSAIINLLAGVKFPTGDTSRLDDEVNSAKGDLNHLAIGGIH